MRDSGGARNRRDLTLLIAARMLRAYAFGFSIVLFGLHLERRGLSASLIGLVLASGLLGSAISSLLAAYVSKRIGRRLTLALIGVLRALAGVALAFATSPWLLVLAGLTG